MLLFCLTLSGPGGVIWTAGFQCAPNEKSKLLDYCSFVLYVLFKMLSAEKTIIDDCMTILSIFVLVLSSTFLRACPNRSIKSILKRFV